jgi:Na+-translocating ferredoxin:NAD+ oxidoreductase subunit A
VGELFLILISTCLVNNLVLDFMLGTDPLFGVSNKYSPAFDMCLLVVISMPVVAVFLYILQISLITPFGLHHLELISTVMLVSVIMLLTDSISKIYKPKLHKRIGVLIPLLMVDCTILGTALLASNYQLTLLRAVFYGLGSAAGFALILLAVTSIREKLSVSDVAVTFRGVAILMITLGLISMAFMGFNGIEAVR